MSATPQTSLAPFIAANWQRTLGFTRSRHAVHFDLAQDVTQEAFLKAIAGIDSFRGDSRLSTWFYTILRRQIATHHRHTTKRQRLVEALKYQPPRPLEAPPHDPLLRAQLQKALLGLSPPQRRIFEWTYLNGKTLPEAALLLGCAEGTARSHLHRALRRLRRDLKHLAPQTSTNGSEARQKKRMLSVYG